MKPVRIRLRHITKLGWPMGIDPMLRLSQSRVLPLHHGQRKTIRKHSAALESQTALLFLAPLDTPRASQVQCCSSVAVTECFLMVGPLGLEPRIYRLKAWCYNRLTMIPCGPSTEIWTRTSRIKSPACCLNILKGWYVKLSFTCQPGPTWDLELTL